MRARQGGGGGGGADRRMKHNELIVDSEHIGDQTCQSLVKT